MLPSKKRVFIGPHEVAGYYSNLAKGFREIGVDCDFITYRRHPFGYGGETRIPLMIQAARFFNGFRGKRGRSIILKVLFGLPGEILQNAWGLYAIFKYDVFIFGFGHSLLAFNFDLRVLRALGKTVISNLSHGADARPPYIGGAYQSEDGSVQPTAVQLLYYSQLKSKKVATFGRFSDIVVGAPLSTSHYSRKKFVNIFAIGLPYCADQVDDHGVEQVDSEFSSRSNESVRILHSPSHPAAKGSASIEQAIAKLKRKGYSIDLIMLRNRPHAEVIREIQLCDFVVDQVYSDTPMAGFATEAAWYGKPAVVGGYGLRYLKEFVPEGMWPPSKICHPEDLVETIEELVRNRDERLKLGTAAMNFVRNNWSVSAVARRYHNLLNEAIPRGWWVEPHLVTYLEGAGQHEEQSRENIRRMVERFGVASLKMSHRSDMELAFLNFANAKQGG